MIDEREKLNQEAERLVKAMMDRDETTRDVVKAMQSQGRSWAKIANCFRLKVLAAALVLIVVGSAAHAANPPCPPGVNPNALCNQPAATNLQSSDLVQVYEYAQTPGTRAATVQQLLAGYPSAIINGAAPPYNIVGDGVTSNDVGMAAALAACAAQGTTLLLPPGKILLSGAGSTTSQLRNCAVVGAGFMAGTNGSATSFGTTILLTSTTTKPFIIGSNWSVSGVNFYWPNQASGTTVYPPLLSDDGSHQANQWWMDHVNIINAYDGIIETSGVSWGEFWVTDSALYAVHDMFKLTNIGDGVHFSGLHFTPGAWLSICNFTCTSAVNAGDQHNTIFHVGGAGAQFFIVASDSYAWRYGIYVDNGATFGGSDIDISWDGMGSVVDSSSGGSYAVQNTMTGSVANCFVPVFGGTSTTNYPCFNLGANGGLALNGFYEIGASGSFVETAGASVYLRNVIAENIGYINDGGDYYAVNVTGVSGGTNIVSQNSRLIGQSASSKVHGIHTGANVPTSLIVQGTNFQFFNDDLSAQTAPTTTISGNWSVSTNGTLSVSLGGTNPVAYWNNNWDKPPKATVANCGAGAGITGALAGFIGVGSTVTTTTCEFTLPFEPTGSAGGNCVFTPSIGVYVSGGPSGMPPKWSLGFSGDMHGAQLFFNCSGGQ